MERPTWTADDLTDLIATTAERRKPIRPRVLVEPTLAELEHTDPGLLPAVRAVRARRIRARLARERALAALDVPVARPTLRARLRRLLGR